MVVVLARPQKPVLPLGAVLDVLDPHEDEGAGHGGDDQPLEQLELLELRRADRPGDGEGAEDQDHRVEGAEPGVEEVGAENEDLGVVDAVDGVGDQKAPEEENLRPEEEPHPELG